MECMGIYKIGWSSNVANRLAEITKGCPYPVRLVHSYECKNPKTEEIRLHEKYSGVRLHDEWFILDEEDICILRRS